MISTIIGGKATPDQTGAFLIALRMKGETPEEIAAFARLMRQHAVTVRPVMDKIFVDTDGTGGDRAGTLNISTTSAFVAAGA